jgi:hypothetical protein
MVLEIWNEIVLRMRCQDALEATIIVVPIR